MAQEAKRYRILERIGGVRGSEIHKAITPDGKRVVAARIYHPGLTQNRELMLSLRDTLRSVANLSHQNILTILGSGTLDGRPYIITEFPVWGTLEDRIRSGTLAALNIIQVFDETADALSSAHAHGIVHGDLQPCDIGFDEDGHVLLSGFGEAQVLETLQTAGASNTSDNTKYLAPEAINTGKPCRASDQYSLAAIMLETIGGSAPGNTGDVILERYGNQTRHAQHTQKSAFSLPGGAIEALHKAMAEHPNDRFSSMDAFAHAFLAAMGRERQCAAGTEKSSAPPAPTRPRKASRILAYVATTLAVALLFIFTIPALSAAWMGDSKDRSITGDASQPILEETTNKNSSINPGDGEDGAHTNLDSANPATSTIDPSQAWIVIQQVTPSPTYTKPTLPSEQRHDPTPVSPQATDLPPTDVPPTDTPPTDTPPTDIPPTNTPPPTSAPEPSPTPTTGSSSFKCSSSPKHPHYCTPTPE